MSDQEHVEVVVFAVRFLLDSHAQADAIGAAEIKRAIAVASALYAGANQQWLRRDIELVLETSGPTLFERRNRGRRDEIIRGVLR